MKDMQRKNSWLQYSIRKATTRCRSTRTLIPVSDARLICICIFNSRTFFRELYIHHDHDHYFTAPYFIITNLTNMTVGPQLPPQLAKRKRSIDDIDTPTSPPRKVQAASAPTPRTYGPTAPTTNPEEIALQNESSDDEYGPSKPSSTKPASVQRPMRPPPLAGPSLPPSHNPDELDIEDSGSEDDYGPSKPIATAPKRVLGPAPPPANLSERPIQAPNNDADSDSSDDDYGPSLPPPPGSYAELQMIAEQKETVVREAESVANSAPKRDDWMLVPPSDSSWGDRVDPTKLKNRKFQSGKGSKAPIEKSGGIAAIWTETPEQKRKRLEDEVLGRAEKALNSSNASSKPGAGRVSKEEEATARRIQEYNDKNRATSLYDVHSKKEGVKEKEDDPSKRGFDREKDMAIGGRMGHGEKREMMAKAKDFGSRFQKGKYL